MRQYEVSAKTKEEAIEQGLQELGVSIGDVDVQVVEEPVLKPLQQAAIPEQRLLHHRPLQEIRF